MSLAGNCYPKTPNQIVSVENTEWDQLAWSIFLKNCWNGTWQSQLSPVLTFSQLAKFTIFKDKWREVQYLLRLGPEVKCATPQKPTYSIPCFLVDKASFPLWYSGRHRLSLLGVLYPHRLYWALALGESACCQFEQPCCSPLDQSALNPFLGSVIAQCQTV